MICQKKKESKISSFFKRSAGFILGVVASPLLGVCYLGQTDTFSDLIEPNSPFTKGLLQGTLTGSGAIIGFFCGGPVGAAIGAGAGFTAGTVATTNFKKNNNPQQQSLPHNLEGKKPLQYNTPQPQQHLTMEHTRGQQSSYPGQEMQRIFTSPQSRAPIVPTDTPRSRPPQKQSLRK